MTKLIAGNWKMNGDKAFAQSLASSIVDGAEGIEHEFLVCPSFVHLDLVSSIIKDSAIKLGAQDCTANEQGAHTGDISADMLASYGCEYVILGHSERRQDHGERSDLVRQKAEKALEQNLKTIICVGETEDQRDEGQAMEVVGVQLDKSIPDNATPENTVIAYEPVWAIGTGKTASLSDILEMHRFIKEELAPSGNFRILYGGSVKPENASEILTLDVVDGALIGGASLKADSYLGIAKAI